MTGLNGEDFWKAEMDTALINHEVAQHLSELADVRKERVADGTVSEYSDGATELLTQQTPLATEGLTAPQLCSQLRQKGAE